MMEIIPTTTNIDFLGKRRIAYIFSLLLTLFTLWVWFDKGDSKYGIDFTGGHEIVVKVDGGANSEDIRKALNAGGVEDALVQAFELSSKEYSVRIGDSLESGAMSQKVKAALEGKFPGQVEIRKTDFVGPTIGNELKRNAWIAIIIGLLGILLYVTVRFEFAFAFGAVIALFHDVMIAMGVYLFVGHTINMSTLAAALTIVGYSVNDTVIVFDRMREEIFKRKNYDLVSLMNEVINMYLSRTIVTSALTWFTALALYVFGGGAISDLSLFLVVGILAGTYSTVFIASPLVLFWHSFETKRASAAPQKA